MSATLSEFSNGRKSLSFDFGARIVGDAAVHASSQIMEVSLQRYGRLTVLSALLFTLVAVFGTVNAFANAAPHTRIGSKSQTTGVSVYYFGQPGFHRLVVCDTKADSDSPYAWWNSGTSHHQPTNRAEAHVGNGNCQHFPVVDNGTGLISYQACRDIPRHFDNCGKWVTTIF